MANITASGGASARGYMLNWALDFNDTADTVAVTATHTRLDGSAAPDPPQAELVFTLNSNVSITLNLLTGMLSVGGAFDGTASKIINSGTRTRTNVRLRVSADRAQALTWRTNYLPPQ